jgi:3-hydroxypropanoate dehydrogenase
MTKESLKTDSLDQLFIKARTHYHWLDKPVGDELIHQMFDLAKMGPTSANCSPMRAIFVKSKEVKEKLKPFLDGGNVEKTMTAPVTGIFAYDFKFFDHLPKLFPHTDAKSWFIGNDDLIRQTAWRNGTLQVAYVMMAARSLGLDCGPMSGFDRAGVKAAFFPTLDGEVNMLCNFGYGDDSKLYPRAPRFDFADVNSIV